MAVNFTTTSVSPATPSSVLNSASFEMVFTLVGGTPAMPPSFAQCSVHAAKLSGLRDLTVYYTSAAIISGHRVPTVYCVRYNKICKIKNYLQHFLLCCSGSKSVSVNLIDFDPTTEALSDRANTTGSRLG